MASITVVITFPPLIAYSPKEFITKAQPCNNQWWLLS